MVKCKMDFVELDRSLLSGSVSDALSTHRRQLPVDVARLPASRGFRRFTGPATEASASVIGPPGALRWAHRRGTTR